MAESSEGSSGPDARLPDKGPREQSTLELLRSISTDTVTLVRKEVELARLEIVEAITARLKAAGAIAAAGMLGLFVLAFLALAAASGLDRVLPSWASRLIVAGGFLLLAVGAIAFAARRFKQPPLTPAETKRTLEEDVEWARQQLKR